MSSIKDRIISASEALEGRDEAIVTDETHHVLGTPLKGPYPQTCEQIVVAMGCFWGVERLFWQQKGVYVTAVGYIGGYTPHPTYEEVCTGRTGHTEGVLVVYDPVILPTTQVMKLFWENHDPTQGLRQGGDIGSQYRSAIFATTQAQYEAALRSRDRFQAALHKDNRGEITSEILHASPFYFAEGYHQGYLAKNPKGYCGLKGTGSVCPV